MKSVPLAGTNDLDDDYARCFEVARHAENFPVASRLSPAEHRRHLAAVYAFARGADDLADEPSPRLGGRAIAPEPAARLAALEAWERGLDGRPPEGVEFIFRALARTRRERELPDRPFRDLLTAFRWDVECGGYETWAALRTYADHSAAPVGRLVLGIAGVRDPICERESDDLCVALQWTNFWQDLSVDWPRGRFYLPEELWGLGSFDRAALDERSAGVAIDPASLPSPWRRALAGGLAEAIRRTEALYQASAALPERAGPELALYLGAVWEGGHRVLAQVQALGDRAFLERPALGLRDRVGAVWSGLRRRKNA